MSISDVVFLYRLGKLVVLLDTITSNLLKSFLWNKAISSGKLCVDGAVAFLSSDALKILGNCLNLKAS